MSFAAVLVFLLLFFILYIMELADEVEDLALIGGFGVMRAGGLGVFIKVNQILENWWRTFRVCKLTLNFSNRLLMLTRFVNTRKSIIIQNPLRIPNFAFF